MRRFITCLLLVALLDVIPPLLSAQQNQRVQKLDAEIEALKKRISEIEKQLQAVENVEKLDLQAKLAEANAKLATAEFGKFDRELRDSNNEWLRGWSSWFLGIFLAIIAIFVAVLLGVSRVFWFWLKSEASRLIADTVEENLNGFKEAITQLDILKNQQSTLKKEADILEKNFSETVDQLNILKNQQRTLEKEHAVSILEDTYQFTPSSDNVYYLLNNPRDLETINEPREEALLDIFEEASYKLALRHWAAIVLADRRSPRLVSSILERLNSAIDSELDIGSYDLQFLHAYIKFLGQIPTLENHQGLTKFLNRLSTSDPRHKDLFLTWTVFALAELSVELNERDSVSILRTAIPDLKSPLPSGYSIQYELARYFDVSNLARYFDMFNEPEGIKEILGHHVIDVIHSLEPAQQRVEDTCLELLQKHDPAFVEEWRARETTDNSEA